MKTDQELLELAAIAAGDKPIRMEENKLLLSGVQEGWNPLTDDGDALRLAHKLGLLSNVQVWPRTLEETRRAIVRTAAEVGAGIRPFPTAKQIEEEWL